MSRVYLLETPAATLGEERLTLKRTASGHTVSFQIEQSPNVAAMRWRAMILIQASSAARCGGMVARPKIHPHKEETWMNFSTQQHKHYCGIDRHAKAMYVCILDQTGTKLVHKTLPTTPAAFLRVIAPYREDLVVGVECMFTW